MCLERVLSDASRYHPSWGEPVAARKANRKARIPSTVFMSCADDDDVRTSMFRCSKRMYKLIVYINTYSNSGEA